MERRLCRAGLGNVQIFTGPSGGPGTWERTGEDLFAVLFASSSSASLTCILPRRTRLLERECCKRALWEGLKVRGLLSVWPRSRPLPLRAASNVFEVQSSRAPILLDQNSTAAEHKLEKQGRGALVSSMACSWWTLAI